MTNEEVLHALFGPERMALLTAAEKNALLKLIQESQYSPTGDGTGIDDVFNGLFVTHDGLEQIPFWPEKVRPPTAAILLQIPGYNSDRARQWNDNRSYYNELMHELWQQQGREDVRQHWRRKHKSWVNNAAKMGQEHDSLEKLAESMNDLNLPESLLVPPPTYVADEPHPIETKEQLDEYLLTLLAWDMRIRKVKFSVTGPCSINYMGQTLKYIGLETFVLEGMEAKTIERDGKKVIETLFYFKSVDAALVNKLYGLPEKTAVKLFGKPLLEAIAETAVDINARTEVAELRRNIEKRAAQGRYFGSKIEFGAWG